MKNKITILLSEMSDGSWEAGYYVNGRPHYVSRRKDPVSAARAAVVDMAADVSISESDARRILMATVSCADGTP